MAHVISIAYAFLLTLAIECSIGAETLKDGTVLENWTGRWLPERTTSPPVVKQELSDFMHGIRMGVSSSVCDDAKTNLTVDWDNSPFNFTCLYSTLVPSWNTKARIEYENIPKYYSARHLCMNESIHYNENIPTFGTHRALWPRYGEYKFVPRQRWIHNLEHGGIVMLYDPCTNPVLVEELRQLVVNCLQRHVITPYTLLQPDRPLALVAWGVRLTMSTVNVHIVKDFITKNALQGPERVSRDGQYDFELLNPAKLVTDTEDSTLCPNFLK